jgi:putative oxidoreductase
MQSSNPSLLARALAAGRALARRLEWFPPLFARLVVGLVFALTGWGKLHNLHGADGVIEYFRSLGIPAPELQAPFAASMELACGLALLAGLCTRLAAVPLIVIMIVALKTTQGEALAAEPDLIQRFNLLFGFPELLYIVLLAWLAIAGAGALSLDRVFFRRYAAA